jgi:hypothetical protein
LNVIIKLLFIRYSANLTHCRIYQKGIWGYERQYCFQLLFRLYASSPAQFPYTNPHRAFRFHPAAHEQQSVRSEMREAKEMPAFVLSPLTKKMQHVMMN